jgi:outer membrane translocation and assembly module TamA
VPPISCVVFLQAKPATVDVNAAIKAVQDQKAAVQAAVSQAVSAKVDAVNGAAATVTKAINDKLASVSAAAPTAGASITISAGKGGRKMML